MYPEYTDDVMWCRKVHKKYGKSFYFGTILFPRPEREATSILYAFFRFPDEYVDTLYRDDSVRALESLTRWKDLWKSAYSGSTYIATLDEQRILRATAYVFHKYQIPYEYSEAFLQAMIQDTHKDRYATYAELESYMYGSASVVGLMMTYIMCSGDERFAQDQVYRDRVLGHARDLGEAFQMTNFLRDIGEDIRDRNRIYIPHEDLHTFGVTEDDITHARITPAFVALMKFQVERVSGLYAKADEGILLLPPRAQRGVRVARVLYSSIIGKIEQARYDVFSSRAHLSFFEKVVVLIKTIILYK